MTRLYYVAPSDEVFEDMKAAATVIWNRYDNPYRTEKLDRIKDIGNIKDNFMYIFAMFDTSNQRACASLLKKETLNELRSRLRDGGNDENYISQITGD